MSPSQKPSRGRKTNGKKQQSGQGKNNNETGKAAKSGMTAKGKEREKTVSPEEIPSTDISWHEQKMLNEVEPKTDKTREETQADLDRARKIKHRPATVARFRHSPKLDLAYRLFGIGADPGQVKDAMRGFQTNNMQCRDEVMRSLRVGVADIIGAYQAYMVEAQRVQKEEEIWAAARATALEAEMATKATCKKRKRRSPAEFDSDVEEICDPGIPDDMWVSQYNALARLGVSLSRVSELTSLIEEIRAFYVLRWTTTQRITKTFNACTSSLARLGAYVEGVEKIVAAHDGRAEGRVWERKLGNKNVVAMIERTREVVARVEALEEVMKRLKGLQMELEVNPADELKRSFIHLKLVSFEEQIRTPVKVERAAKRAKVDSTSVIIIDD